MNILRELVVHLVNRTPYRVKATAEVESRLDGRNHLNVCIEPDEQPESLYASRRRRRRAPRGLEVERKKENQRAAMRDV